MRKQISDGTLFVFWDESLIYKRRLSVGCGLILDKWGLPWRPRDRDPRSNLKDVYGRRRDRT